MDIEEWGQGDPFLNLIFVLEFLTAKLDILLNIFLGLTCRSKVNHRPVSGVTNCLLDAVAWRLESWKCKYMFDLQKCPLQLGQRWLENSSSLIRDSQSQAGVSGLLNYWDFWRLQMPGRMMWRVRDGVCQSLETLLMSVSGQERRTWMEGGEEGRLGCHCVFQAKKTNKTPTSPSCLFRPLHSRVIDANNPPNGPARRISNLQMTAFAGTTNH